MVKCKQYNIAVYNIIGAAMTVHSELGWGLLESVYQEALHMELLDRGIANECEKEISCYYKNHLLNKKFKADIVVDDIIIELKSCQELIPAHRAQLFNYMRLTKTKIGILINYGNSHLQCERYGYNEETNECRLLNKFLEIIPSDSEDDESET